MATERRLMERGVAARQRPAERQATRGAGRAGGATLPGTGLLQQLGNRGVQRLLAQRSASEPTELDDETANRIHRAQGGGQPLDESVSAQAGAALGHDFSGVRVHTSPEADRLSRQLGAVAFTTGRDIFFREGAYAPHSASGQELLGHELAHVVQQSGSGASAGRMTVNPPGDALEQEADGVAKALVGPAPAAVQRQEPEPEEDEDEKIQTQEDEEEQVP